MSKAEDEQVQLECVKILKLLLTRFPKKEIIVASAESIALMFSSTAYADVAVACIESFKDLSILQYRLFDGGRFIRSMHSILPTLTRFPPEKQAILLAAFQSIATILEDPDLLTSHEGSAALPVSPTPLEGAKDMGTAGTDLARLTSLLRSEESAVRRFALQKTSKLLQPPPEPCEDPPDEDSPNGEDDKDDPARAANSSRKTALTATHLKELASSLFACLKNSVRARNAVNLKKEVRARSDEEKGARREGPQQPSLERKSDKDKGKELPLARVTDGPSKAGRLILAALQSPESDVGALGAALDCLLLLSRYPLAPQGDDRQTEDRSRCDLLTGQRLTAAEAALREGAGEAARLLLTLSHADELSEEAERSPNLSRQDRQQLAEKAAVLFGIVTSAWKVITTLS